MRKIIKCWNKREHEENDKILKRLSLHPSMLDIVFSSSSSNVAEEGVDVDILLNISGHVKTKSFPRAFEWLMSSGGEIRLRLRRILLFTYSFGWDKTICCKTIQISSWILQKRRAGGKAFKGIYFVASFSASFTSFVLRCQVELNVSSIIPKPDRIYLFLSFSTMNIQRRQGIRPEQKTVDSITQMNESQLTANKSRIMRARNGLQSAQHTAKPWVSLSDL